MASLVLHVYGKKTTHEVSIIAITVVTVTTMPM